VQGALSESLFKAYFTDGRDIGNRQVLIKIVEEAGLPGSAAKAFLDSPEGTREVSTKKKAP
jgi:predicted DsbA family dithiol-disulfide isomerase